MEAKIPRKILVRGVNWLGDAVMTTPALLRLREAQPQAEITLLTVDKLSDIWRGHPAVDAVETFGAKESSRQVGKRLREKKYELALVLPNSPRSALDVWWARIPRRVGYAKPWRNFLLTKVVAPRSGVVMMRKRSEAEIKELVKRGVAEPPPPVSAHQMFHYLHLVAALGGKPEPVAPRLEVPDAAVAQFVEKFKLGAGSLPWFGLNPMAEYGPAKRWPEERFTEAAIEIQRRTKCRWLIFGLKADAEMAERMAANISQAAGGVENATVSLAGKTNLGELCAALKLCRVLLTNDSGPMHVAAALGTPVVALFGSTSPELTGPGLPGDGRHQLLQANAPCSPCFLRECPIDFRCMTGIGVERAVEAVMKVVGDF